MHVNIIIEVTKMSSIVAFLTTKEIMIVYLVAVGSIFLYFVVSMIDKNSYKRRRKHNTRELNKIVEEVNEVIEIDKEESSAIESMIEDLKQQEEAVFIEPVEEKVDIPVIISSEVVEEPLFVSEVNEKEENEANSAVDLETSVAIEEVDTVNSDKCEEVLTYTDIAPNKTEAQEELLKLTKELEEASEKTQNIDLTAYEEQQEKDAIISLDELMQKTKVMYENNELTKFEDEGDEPISLQDLEKKFSEAKTYTDIVEVDIEEMKNEEKTELKMVQEKLVLNDFDSLEVEEEHEVRPIYQGFKSTPIISPVYGIATDESKMENIELENTANYEKLDEEIRKTNEFLMTLKELKKNLE